MINIIGGEFKKKRIYVPTKKVRPTSSIKREAIFSILESFGLKNSYDPYKNKCFIDLFAGSGALGLEAVSRGASFSYFYENNKQVLEVLKKNCDMICKSHQYSIFEKNINLFKKFKINYSLSAIFIDPPYKFNLFEKVLNNIISSNILEKNSIIIIETSNNNLIQIPDLFQIIVKKNYGKTKLFFLKKLR